MGLGDRGWSDKLENYADSYLLALTATTVTAIQGQDYKQPAVVYSLSICVNPSTGSGDVTLVDGSATADSGDTRKIRVAISSAISQNFAYHAAFPRGIAFNTGIIVSATTCTGAITVTYKSRYP